MNRPSLTDLARQRVVILDGAMGTSVHKYPLELQRDWLNHENCTEILTLSRPDVITEIHDSFFQVGCDAVETNTFGANTIVLAEFGLEDKCHELNLKSALLARDVARRHEKPGRPTYVVGAMGPGTKLISLQNVTWAQMEASYHVQARGLLEGGVDALLLETCQDLLQIKCALAAIRRAMRETGVQCPIIVQASFDTQNKMLMGSDAPAFVASIGCFDEVQVLGLNCAAGPVEMAEHVRYIAQNSDKLVSVLPNAGIPVSVDGHAHFPLGPEDFARAMHRFVHDYGVNIVGGCCGTTPAHLAALVKMLGHHAAVARSVNVKAQAASLTAAEDLRQDNSYLIIAERTNTNGSRQFKRLLQAEDWDGLVSMARDEVRDGSHMLDVCVDFVGRDGVRDMREVVGRFVRQIPTPLMIDSTNPAVMEAALQLAGGRCVLNSMNLEDGEQRVGEICRLARDYGAAVVAGTIDEDKKNAMARTAERKLSIARRLRDLAVDRFGLSDDDLLFDPLVLPISTGIEEDRRNALETIEGIRLITQHLPRCHTVVGLSNVSFGLKPAARVVLNSVFLHECRRAGLTAAIVHASKLLPQNRIPAEQWEAALDLIYDRRREGFDPLTHFVSLFGDEATPVDAAEVENLSIEEKLKRHIVDGEKRNLSEHLQEAMQAHPPLEIINNILLAGMKVVGDLFGSGQMQLPFVLQSAETMKAAVAFLQPFMERVEGSSKGVMVLATVKGDVHDIGKNLVDIILSNNGYTVYNLGIKQPISDILDAARKHQAHAVGMSGLLVKSVAVMRENLEEMNAQGVDVPVLLGGAALTRDYAEEDLAGLYNGPLIYCKDAFEGLHAMDAIRGGRLEELMAEQRQRVARRRAMRESAVKPASLESVAAAAVARDNPVPTPPFWGRRVIRELPPRHIFPYINEDALFLGQWGFRKKGLTDEAYQRILEEKARPVFIDLQRRAEDEGFIRPMVVYGYFPAQGQGDSVIIFDPQAWLAGQKRQIERFDFPRQDGRRRLCIADFFRPVDSGEMDVLGIQLVTVGSAATELAERLRAQDRYQDYLYLHGFGVESAEALAELWHKRMRQELGFGSEDADLTRDIFHQKYRGSRYSFGYPACPNLEDRSKLMRLLKPEEIGVSLSENHMLEPEQSTDAIVVHHPQAKYFDI